MRPGRSRSWSPTSTCRATQVLAVFPNLPVVIVSGRPEVFQSSWQHTLGYTLMKKPYRPSELIRVVRSLTE